MEAERARPGAQVGEAAVRDARAARHAEERVEAVEVGDERRAVAVAVDAECLPDLDEAGAERLVAPDLRDVADDRGRHSPRGAEIAKLRTVELARKPACALERVGDRV